MSRALEHLLFFIFCPTSSIVTRVVSKHKTSVSTAS